MKDIRPIKTAMREHFKDIRRSMPPEHKLQLDRSIAHRVAALWQYKRCRQLLVYVSTPIEVDTHAIIRRALADGKQVAVPRCVPGTRNMEFYAIRGLEDCEPGTFGVLEPLPERCELVENFSDSLCLVPALCYDWKGFRLGYGKGYYDRFLDGYEGFLAGICYSACVRPKIPHGRYDRPVDLLVTERYLRRTTLAAERDAGRK